MDRSSATLGRRGLARLGLVGLLSGLLVSTAVVASPAGAGNERGIEQRILAGGCPSHGEMFEPGDGKTLLIVGQDRDSTDEYVEAVGVVPGGFMTYSHITAPILGVHFPINFGGWSHGQHFVDKYPNTVMQIGMGIDPTLVPLGVTDAGIRVFADWLKSVNRPVFVRLGYEFDHQNKGWDPAEYATAYRYVVDRLRAQGVDNVAYVWHSAGHGNPNLAAWYPGDDYVDWVAVSIFNHGYRTAPQNLVHANRMADFGDAQGKPMMIAESTPHASDSATANPNGLWNNWHQNVLDFIEARGVKAWSYINQNWEEVGWEGWGDSRVQNNPILKDLWLNAIGQERFLQQSPGLYCSLGYPGSDPTA